MTPIVLMFLLMSNQGILEASGLSNISGHEVIFNDKTLYEKYPEYLPIVKDEINNILTLGKNQVIISSVESQNNENLPLAVIKERDKKWKASLKVTPFKKTFNFKKATRLIRSLLGKSYRDRYAEIFVTDNKGANVAAYPLTSDYWQGDEAKWLKSFNTKRGNIFIGPIEYDQSADSKSIQISVPILNKSEVCIGVMVVGIKELYLRKQAEEKTKVEKNN